MLYRIAEIREGALTAARHASGANPDDPRNPEARQRTLRISAG